MNGITERIEEKLNTAIFMQDKKAIKRVSFILGLAIAKVKEIELESKVI